MLSVGIADQSDSRAAMACAMSVDPTLLAEAFEGSPTSASRVAFICDLIGARRHNSRSQKAGLRSLIEALDPSYREIGRALLRGALHAAPISPQALEILQQAAEAASPRILAKIVPLLIKAGDAPSEPIRRWLSETREKDLAEAAASAAIRIEDEEAIAMALQHPRANARVVALALRSSSPLSAALSRRKLSVIQHLGPRQNNKMN